MKGKGWPSPVVSSSAHATQSLRLSASAGTAVSPANDSCVALARTSIVMVPNASHAKNAYSWTVCTEEGTTARANDLHP